MGSLGLAPAVSERWYTLLAIPESYRLIVQALDGEAYTEDINVMYFDRLTLRFNEWMPGYAVLEFEGTDVELFWKIVLATFQ